MQHVIAPRRHIAGNWLQGKIFFGDVFKRAIGLAIRLKGLVKSGQMPLG
jgi:hypothetical protein